MLDQVIDEPPETVTVQVIERLREVRDFDSKEALMEQIQQDVEKVRNMLS